MLPPVLGARAVLSPPRFPQLFHVLQAGGRAIDGCGNRILDIVPEKLRQKTGAFLGSKDDIDELEQALR